MALTLADTIRLASDEHGAVLLDEHGGQMYGLNPSAAVFCAALADGADRESATNTVIGTFDGDESAIRADLDAFIAALIEHRLAKETP
jgi:hypothetical protein